MEQPGTGLLLSPQELGKTWEEVQSEDDGELGEEERDEYDAAGRRWARVKHLTRLCPLQRLVGLESSPGDGRVSVL